MATELIYVDFDRCLDCRACEVACARRHRGQSRIRVLKVADRFAAPLACRHCHQAPCVQVCYPGALQVRETRVVLETEKCTGCGLCVFACPFGAMGFDWQQKIPYGCDLCGERQAAGRAPLCVSTCPIGAIQLGPQEKFTAALKRRAGRVLVRAAGLEVGDDTSTTQYR